MSEMTTPATLRVAVAQMNSGSDKDTNLATMQGLIAEAAAQGADLVAFPEYSTFLGPDTQFSQVAESIPGPSTRIISEAARRAGLSVLIGSLVERASSGELFNTSVLMDADGQIRGTYQKVHLFTATLADAPGSESTYITPGSDIRTAEWSGLTVGMSICFDLRFPELYRELAHLGSDIITVPAAFTKFTGIDHWEVLLRSRAIENQAFVIAPNQVGTFDGGESFGHSCIIDPWGTVLAVVQEGTGIAVADLELSRLSTVREQLPALANRRFGRSPIAAV
jgi:deaminated glutathione amidase